MSKVQPKMIETAESVNDFIKKVPDQQKQKDSRAIIEIMQRKSGFEPKMWGPSIVGFGKYHYKYESGHEGDSALMASHPGKPHC